MPGLRLQAGAAETMGFIRLALDAWVLGRGLWVQLEIGMIVFWWEDSTDEYTSYFGRKSLNPLTMKILCW